MVKTRFRFTPSNILKGFGGPYGGEAIGAWQWIVRKLAESKTNLGWGTPYEWINGTSSIHNSAPHPFGVEEFWVEPNRRMQQLFICAGDATPVGKFLARHCMIASWPDLVNPIIATVQTSGDFPNSDWFRMAGRTFKKSPNSFHPSATFVQDAQLELDCAGKLWAVSVAYGYPHDSSSWRWRIRQNDGERIDAFSARVNKEIEAAMVPDDDRFRSERESERSKSHAALAGVFVDSHYRVSGWEDAICDAISKTPKYRIPMTRPRVRTLVRWANEARPAT